MWLVAVVHARTGSVPSVERIVAQSRIAAKMLRSGARRAAVIASPRDRSMGCRFQQESRLSAMFGLSRLVIGALPPATSDAGRRQGLWGPSATPPANDANREPFPLPPSLPPSRPPTSFSRFGPRPPPPRRARHCPPASPTHAHRLKRRLSFPLERPSAAAGRRSPPQPRPGCACCLHRPARPPSPGPPGGASAPTAQTPPPRPRRRQAPRVQLLRPIATTAWHDRLLRALGAGLPGRRSLAAAKRSPPATRPPHTTASAAPHARASVVRSGHRWRKSPPLRVFHSSAFVQMCPLFPLRSWCRTAPRAPLSWPS